MPRHVTNGWSYLNETWYIERSYVSYALFLIQIGSGDTGDWRGETEILENAESRKIGMKLDGKNNHKF